MAIVAKGRALPELLLAFPDLQRNFKHGADESRNEA